MQSKNDAARYDQQQKLIFSTAGYVILGVYGLWVILSLVCIVIVMIRWCRVPKARRLK